MDTTIESEGLRLSGHLAKAPGTAAGRPRHGLVLCHGFPAGPKAAGTSGETYPELADRLAHETGWSVLTFNFRGTGESDGQFSLAGWVADLRAAVAVMRRVHGVDEVWVGGFSTGGAVALEVAATDPAIGGVAAFASPADFGDWAANPKRFLAHARDVGVVRGNSFPEDFEAWALELKEVRPVAHVEHISPRPLLIVHGSEDNIVPLHEARALADAAGPAVELRIVTGGGHRLRHDPRAIAVLIGWLERQHPPAAPAPAE